MGSYCKTLKKRARLKQGASTLAPEKRQLDFTPKLTTISPEEYEKRRSGVYSYIL